MTVRNVLIALAGLSVLGLVAGLTMGDVVRHFGDWQIADVNPVRRRRLQKPA